MRKRLPETLQDQVDSLIPINPPPLFDTAGNERAASPQECVHLERSAVWEQDSVEGRLLDTFMGRPNADEEHLKVRLR